MCGHLCSRLECHRGGKVQEIAQERKDGNMGVGRNARLDRNEQHFARKMEKMAPRRFQCGCPGLLVAHVSSAGGELRDGFGDLHSSFTMNFEAASVCRPNFPSQGGYFCWLWFLSDKEE